MKKYYIFPLTEIVDAGLNGGILYEGGASDPEQGEVSGPMSNENKTFEDDGFSADINKSGLWED